MKYLKSYKIFESNSDDLVSDLDDIALELKDQGVNINVFTTSDIDRSLWKDGVDTYSERNSGLPLTYVNSIQCNIFLKELTDINELSDVIIRMCDYMVGWKYIMKVGNMDNRKSITLEEFGNGYFINRMWLTFYKTTDYYHVIWIDRSSSWDFAGKGSANLTKEEADNLYNELMDKKKNHLLPAYKGYKVINDEEYWELNKSF